jgi:dihydrofolate reductase
VLSACSSVPQPATVAAATDPAAAALGAGFVSGRAAVNGTVLHFVISHHPRPPVPMDGGTEFRFVEDIERALHEATGAAGGRHIRLGGGASVIRQPLHRALVDEMHLAVTPVLLGSGEHLLSGLDLPALGYELTEHIQGEGHAHGHQQPRAGVR